MGLIMAAAYSAIGTMSDQWLEYIYCDSMSSDVLMMKGRARTTGVFGNTGRNENIISDGSKIAVNDGQCMIIVENGKIIDYTSVSGAYVYNTLTEPSMFDSSDYSLRDSFSKVGERFRYGGVAGNDQRVYFVNTKDILDNKVGMGEIPFRDAEFNMTIMLKVYGTYTFKIKDPLLFYTNIASNVVDSYESDTIRKQLRTEIQSALLPAISGLAQYKLRYDEIPLRTNELVAALNEAIGDKWLNERGIALTNVSITSIVPNQGSVEQMRQLQESSVYASNTQMLGARMGASQADAMGIAAGNSAGAFTGFANMNMAAMGSGINANQLLNPQMGYPPMQQGYPQMQQGYPPMQQGYPSMQQGYPPMQPSYPQMQPEVQPAPQPSASENWKCSCGQEVNMPFCPYCGTKKPEEAPKPTAWMCSCGHESVLPFCGYCGSKKPKKLVCDKCGFSMEGLPVIPKFCPQCGDVIDENDEVDE